jgi:hypothetical protein
MPPPSAAMTPLPRTSCRRWRDRRGRDGGDLGPGCLCGGAAAPCICAMGGGIPGTSAIIGGNLPHAAGGALGRQDPGARPGLRRFFGDGTLMAGAAYEAMKTSPSIPCRSSSSWRTISTPSRLMSASRRETRLSSRGPCWHPRHRGRRDGAAAVRRAMRRRAG